MYISLILPFPCVAPSLHTIPFLRRPPDGVRALRRPRVNARSEHFCSRRDSLPPVDNEFIHLFVVFNQTVKSPVWLLIILRFNFFIYPTSGGVSHKLEKTGKYVTFCVGKQKSDSTKLTPTIAGCKYDESLIFGQIFTLRGSKRLIYKQIFLNAV